MNTNFKIKKNWIIIGVLAILVIMAWTSYNGMVGLEEKSNSQWGNVQNAYQRRLDLIPNLVNTVKGYATHEQETLIQVVEARAKATNTNVNISNLNAKSIQSFQQNQDALSGALSKLMVVVEKYPDLKANENFLQLQSQLEGTENRINVERRKFNEAVKNYNKKIKKLPGKLFNLMYGFEAKVYFEASKGAEVAPEVKF